MEAVKIDVYISDLLYQYDCVIVPDFGGFVANYAPAKILPIQHKFLPPSKQISFNKNLKNNDGLLSNHIAERKSISYQSAMDLIQEFVNESYRSLEKGDKISIEKVGTLYLDPERNLQFKAEEQNDYLIDSFGLKSIRAKPILRDGAEERIERKIKAAMPLIKAEEKKKRKYYWPAAAILLGLLASSLFLNQQFELVDTKLDYAFFGPNQEVAPTYSKRSTPIEEVSISEAREEGQLVLSDQEFQTLELSEGLTQITIKSEPNPEKFDVEEPTAKNDTPVEYHVIGGCFSNMNNAKRLVKKLQRKGFAANLLGEYKNLYAVAYESFALAEDAKSTLEQVKKEENSSAWILKKRF